MKTYYVYQLINPLTNLPFYVGKGKGDRAHEHLRLVKRGVGSGNTYKDNVIKQILNENLEPTVEYLFDDDCPEIAYNFETALIKKLGRKRFDKDGILTNLCEDNRPPNQKGMYTEARKEIYRKRMLGNSINTGRKQSEEEKAQRGLTLKNAYATGARVVTDKMREATRLTHTGKVVSDITKQKQSESAMVSHAWRKGKTNEEIFGKEKADEIRKKKSLHKPPNCKEIIIDGITYQSIRAASNALGISEYKVTKLC